MTDVEKESLAKQVGDSWYAFNEALRDKRKYPKEKFDAFLRSAWTYAERTRKEKLVHREVVAIINGLVDLLGAERKRVPERVLYDAERLECLFFCGYDPHFGGDEPPGF